MAEEEADLDLLLYSAMLLDRQTVGNHDTDLDTVMVLTGVSLWRPDGLESHAMGTSWPRCT